MGANMGTWGTGLLDNDVAADASLSFDDVLQGGGSVAEAIDAAMQESEDLIDDEDDRADLVLALAWLAAEQRAVPDWLAAEARQVISSGRALSQWEGTPEYAARQAVERQLLGILDGSAPHPGRPDRLQSEDIL
jgi:hypothetical protein